MKLRLSDVKKALYLCSALFFLVSIHIAAVYVFAVHRFSVSYDAHLSQKAQSDIEGFIKLTELYAKRPSEIVHTLQCEFPFIKTVSCWYKPLSVHLEVKAYRPFMQLKEAIGLCRLSEPQVVTENNYCVNADLFESYSYACAPGLQISQDDQDRLPVDVFAYLSSIDPLLIEKSSIFWRHRHEIVFDLYQRSVRLLLNYDNYLDEGVLNSCDIIAQDLAKGPIFAKGFCADVRFEDRIIISKLKS